MTKPVSYLAEQLSSQLLIIDMQEKLAAVMPEAEMQAVTRSCANLLQAANLLAVPVLVSEQYPQGLGPTLADLQAHLQVKPVAKTAFSCVQVAEISRQLVGDRPQLILAGMEAHICVLQTALDLLARGKQVMVVTDAIISRNALHQQNALQRLQQAGCIMTNSESVMFEWLRVAQGDAFKAISKLIR